MAGTQYVVAIDFQTRGSLTSGLSRLSSGVTSIGASVSKLQGSFGQIGSGVSRLMGPLDAVVSKVIDVGLGIAKWGAAGALGLATYGVVGLNNELEKTKISLGTIFSVQGKANGMGQGMAMASDQIAKMRKDAVALPGEFEDLIGIFRTAAIPGFQAGLSVDKMREMSAKIMAAGAVSGLPMDQVAREAAMLLSGRSGAHNVLGMRLMGLSGDSAEKFNKSAPEKRAAQMAKELDKFAPAIEAFGTSFDSTSSAFIDYLKQFGQGATSGLFDAVKESLSEANNWFSTNKATINEWAGHISFQLKHAFYVGVEAVQEWWPSIRAFATNAYARIAEIWERIQPSVERFGLAVQSALKDPGTIDKLIKLAEIYAGIKVAGGVLGTVGAIGTTLGGFASIAKIAGIGGGGAASAAAGGGAAAGIASRSIAFLGGLESFTSGVTIAGTTFTGLAGSIIGVTGVLGALGLAVGAAYVAYEAYASDTDAIAEHYENLRATTPAFKAFSDGMIKGNEFWANILFDHEGAMSLFASEAEMAAARLARIANDPNGVNTVVNDHFLALAKAGVGSGAAGVAEREIAKKGLHPGGGGGTHIQKVEIVVTGNPEPSRVAREVKNELANLGARRKMSPDVADYSRPPG